MFPGCERGPQIIKRDRHSVQSRKSSVQSGDETAAELSEARKYRCDVCGRRCIFIHDLSPSALDANSRLALP